MLLIVLPPKSLAPDTMFPNTFDPNDVMLSSPITPTGPTGIAPI